PDQLPVEPYLAPNPPELDNDYLDAVDYDEEEDPEEDPEMDLDEEENDPEMEVDNEEEEPLLASPPPLSLLRTPPLVSESSSDSDIPVTTTTNVGRPFKGPLSTYEVGEPSSIASASVFSTRYELNQTEIVEAHKEVRILQESQEKSQKPGKTNTRQKEYTRAENLSS
ncbi:hypothetical protein Tco_1332342, partial [Tanacetum coccineum]